MPSSTTSPAARGRNGTRTPSLGLRANLSQFVLLVAVNALVGGMLGQERTVLPLLAAGEFGLTAHTAALTFIAAFGLSKAAANYAAGTWSDRYGRKPVLVAGWLVAVPVPLLLIWAPTWTWVIIANILLGISQGLTWSTTVVMKIDLAGPARRGLAMGLNEAAGYGAVAATALATGYIAAHAGLRPEPFYLGIAFSALGLGASVLFVRLGQVATGALSDRWGRKPFIVIGMLTQAVALGIVALSDTFWTWLAAAVLLGAGTAMVYPTLLAAIGDVAHPSWRARSVGIYRLWLRRPPPRSPGSPDHASRLSACSPRRQQLQRVRRAVCTSSKGC